jgi:AcrR family transcriptional regulator
VTTTETGRGPGRPRSARAHQAILDSAIELLLEDGFTGMSMEGVAARAGVGKATIYRRWSSKTELVAEAIACLKTELELPDTGSVRADLLDLGRQALASLGDPEYANLLARMRGETAKHPELREAYQHKLVTPRREVLAAVIRRGIERGELRADLDIELLVDMVVGPVIYRSLIGGRFGPDHLERLADGILEGIRRR